MASAGMTPEGARSPVRNAGGRIDERQNAAMHAGRWPIRGLAAAAAGAIFLLPMADGPAGAGPAESLKAHFPRISAESVGPSPVPGLYEVVLPDEILYYSPEAQCIVAGPIVSSDGKNLTRERFSAIIGQRMKEIPLDKAIRIGTGKNRVIEITDPDCPYCRQASGFLAGRSDLTRYVFFFPLSMHKDAEAKARHVLCRQDRALAYEEAMTGRLDGKALPPCPDPAADELLAAHRAVARKAGITGTPFFLINGEPLFGADLDRMGKLLDGRDGR